MKSIFLILTAGLFLTFSADAQKKKTVVKTKTKQLVVPENVNTSFKNQYNTIEKNNWSKNYSGNYVADFMTPTNEKISVEYSRAGGVIKTKTAYQLTSVPELITTALQRSYADAKVTEVTKVEIPGVAPYYTVKLTRADNKNKQLLISEDGTITD